MAKRKATKRKISKSKKKSKAIVRRPAKKSVAKKKKKKKKKQRGKKSRRVRKVSDVRRPKKKHVHPKYQLHLKFPGIIPKRWKPVPKSDFTETDLSRAAAQMAQRFAEKIVGGGHKKNSVEAKILQALIVAEQTGHLNEAYYEQAGEYDGYETPQDIYRLWIYSGA